LFICCRLSFRLTHALYHAYWVENLDISQPETLLSIVQKLSITVPSHDILSESLFSDPQLSKSLSDATSEAVNLGAPGVPFFYLPDVPVSAGGSARTFWGQDRLHFLESALSTYIRQQQKEHQQHVSSSSTSWLFFSVPQTRRTVQSKPLMTPKTLEVFWDLSSPWSYLGWSQLERIKQEVGPLLTIVNRPILVGALFKEYVFCIHVFIKRTFTFQY
jgi:2-hydroxychromene-2-carboxylate isomerase